MTPGTPLPSRAANNGQAGFTLLEILLALFVFAMIMTMIAMTMGKSFTLMQSAEGQAEIEAMARTTLLQIQEDMEAMPLLPPLQPTEDKVNRQQFILIDQTEDGHDHDSVRFLSLAPQPARDKGPEQRQLTLISYEAEWANDKTLTLFRRAHTPGQPSPLTDSRAVLCELLTGIDFKAATGAGEERADWDSDANPESGLPQRITVSLRFHDPASASEETHFTTSFLIPVSASR